MLINFSVENFLTFDKIVSLTMKTGTSRQHPENIYENDVINLQRFTAIYGANASGKTGLFKAIECSWKMIIFGIDEFIGIQNFAHAGNIKNKERRTRFEYDIKIGERLYSYGFAMILSKRRITEEWLYDITDKKEELIYSRQLKQGEEAEWSIDQNISELVNSRPQYVIEVNMHYLSLKEEDKKRLDIYIEDGSKLPSRLLLNYLSNDKDKLISDTGASVFSDVYSWFRNTLQIVSVNDAVPPEYFGKNSWVHESYQKEIIQFLNENGTGIINLEKIKLDGQPERISNEAMVGIEQLLNDRHDLFSSVIERLTSISDDVANSYISQDEDLRDYRQTKIAKLPFQQKQAIYLFELPKGQDQLDIYELRFQHEGLKYPMSLEDESDGTRRLVELFNIIHNQEEKVYIVDEIDRSLHPILAFDFVERFLAKEPKNSQVIATTHEDRLLDQSLLRRDEIWFMEKDETGSSQLYSLEEFKERKDRDILRAYLGGRYGAIPKLKKAIEDKGRK
ncbi:AAA family ATPase [Streptococcus sp. 32226D021BW]